MYSLTVREHIMIAHSFRGRDLRPGATGAWRAVALKCRSFPAQRSSTPTALVEMTNLAAATRLAVLEFNFRNLDELEGIPRGRNTTTEFMAGDSTASPPIRAAG